MPAAARRFAGNPARLFLVGLCLLAGAPAISGLVRPVPGDKEVAVASGTLVHHELTDDLFHIDNLWMKVKPDTAFHRWLMQGVDRTAFVILTTNPARFLDADNVRILPGRLMHNTTPAEGGPPMHVLFLKDELTRSLGAVTFQTDDPAIVKKVEPFCGAPISVIIEIS